MCNIFLVDNILLNNFEIYPSGNHENEISHIVSGTTCYEEFFGEADKERQYSTLVSI